MGWKMRSVSHPWKLYPRSLCPSSLETKAKKRVPKKLNLAEKKVCGFCSENRPVFGIGSVENAGHSKKGKKTSKSSCQWRSRFPTLKDREFTAQQFKFSGLPQGQQCRTRTQNKSADSLWSGFVLQHVSEMFPKRHFNFPLSWKKASGFPKKRSFLWSALSLAENQIVQTPSVSCAFFT